MDLKAYYDSRRKLEPTLPDPCVVVSLKSGGGEAGVKTGVRRRVAAKMIVDGAVRQASAEEAKAFHEEKAEAKRVAEQLEAASRMQVTVMPSNEWRKRV
ncbi:MAG: hypothetical protein M1541_22425 [Acidobacteria bacterium]|nr:hypothetical protein [Acidobacteriota bacterium]